MKITKKQLRKIINEYLLLEIDPSIDRAMGGAPIASKKISDEEFKKFLEGSAEALLKSGPDVIKLAVQALDPTGVTSIPDVPPALEDFEKNKSFLNLAFLILAVLAVIPVAGKLGKLGSAILRRVKIAITGSKIKLTGALKEGSEKAVREIDKILAGSKTATIIKNIPDYGQPTTIGYHGTSRDSLESLKKHGLNNKIGRESGKGLDSMKNYPGMMMPTVSNWTYAPEGALEFASEYGDQAALLRFDTSDIVNYKGFKSNRDWGILVGSTKKGSKEIIYKAIPKNQSDPELHKYFFISEKRSFSLDILGKKVIDQTDQIKIREKFDYFDHRTGDKITDPELLKLITNPNSGSLTYFKPYEKLRDAKTIGSSDKPIPPEIIEVSLDGGKTFKRLIDLEI